MKERKNYETLTPGMLQEFAETSFAPVTVEEAGIVTVVMNSNYQLENVSIKNTGLVESSSRQLEQAIRTAVNKSLTEVVRRNGEKLTALLERTSDSKT